MKVLHVVPTYYPAVAWGGPIFSVYGLCNALAQISGVQLQVLTTDSARPRCRERLVLPAASVSFPAGYSVHYTRRIAGASIAPGLLVKLGSMVRWADVVHLTGVYSFPTIPVLLTSRLIGRPLIWSPRGALQRWEGSRKVGLKRVWDWLCSGILDGERCALHVTSAEEAAESKDRISCGRIEVIPNGVDIPPALPERVWRPDGRLRLMYIGRLDPKKGIENLFQALARLVDSVTLSVYGDGDPVYRRWLERLVSELGLSARVRFFGHVDDDAKREAFRQADLCVVPSYTENFAMVVAESLAHGVPVIASRGTPWARVREEQCGDWVDNRPGSLADAIQRLASADLPRLGVNGRAWMQREYSWQSQAARMLSLYQRVSAKD